MFILASIAISFAMAADKPMCSGKAISRNCEFFSERAQSKYINTADYTGYPNPAYMPAAQEVMKQGNMPMPSIEDLKLKDEAEKDKIRKQAELTAYKGELLDILDGKGLSSHFKLLYAEASAAAATEAKTENAADIKILVPWPPDQKGAATKEVSKAEIDNFLRKKMGKNFSELEKVVGKRIDKESFENQKVQREIMQKEVERQKEDNKNADLVAAKEKRAKDIFDEVKKDVEDIVTRGKPEKQWTEVEKAMVEKIRGLKLTSNEEARKSILCTEDPYNAAYNVNGEVMVCPGRFFAPDAHLATVLAHEVGHAIDPCHFQMPRVAVNRKEIGSYKDKENNTAAGTPLFFANGVYYDDLELQLEPKAYKALLDEGIIKIERKGFSADQYPFKQERSCLAKKGFNDNSAKDIKDTIAFLRKSANLSSDPAAARIAVDQYERAMKKYPHCHRAASHENQMGEVCGDMFGALILEKHVAGKKFANEEEKVGSFLFASEACKPQHQGVTTPRSMAASMAIISRDHPVTPARSTHILLSLPRIAEAYDCKRVGNGCFDHLSLLNRKSGKSANSESAVKSQGSTK